MVRYTVYGIHRMHRIIRCIPHRYMSLVCELYLSSTLGGTGNVGVPRALQDAWSGGEV